VEDAKQPKNKITSQRVKKKKKKPEKESGEEKRVLSPSRLLRLGQGAGSRGKRGK
jgi:hypothetical protein